MTWHAALARYPTVNDADGAKAVRAADLFDHPVVPIKLPLNRKTTANERQPVVLTTVMPSQATVPVSGLAAYAVRPRLDPPDVAHLVYRDGRERYVIQEGHTRMGAAKLRGDASVDTRVWEFVENAQGKWDPVPRGLHKHPSPARGDRGHFVPHALSYRERLVLLLGGPGSGNFGHAGRPGEVGGSSSEGGGEGAARPSRTPAAIHEAQEQNRQLRHEWATANDQLLVLKREGKAQSPEAKVLHEKMKELVKQRFRLDADPGGIGDIMLPGGPRDVLIIGAGPGGMSAATNAGAEGLDTLMIEASEAPGGASKHSSRIENYNGFPTGESGEEMARLAYEQTQRMGAETKFNTRVTGIDKDPDGFFTATLSNGEQVKTRSVILATGVEFKTPDFPGADLPGVSVVNGDQLIRDAGPDGHAVVLGGSNGAAQAVLGAAHEVKNVTLVSRSPLTKSMSVYQQDAIHAAEKDRNVKVVENQISHITQHADGKQLVVHMKDGSTIEADSVGVFFGGLPSLQWLPEAIRPEHGDGVAVNPATNETGIPGVFAVGDNRLGGKNRVSAAMGEGGGVISEVFKHFERQQAGKGQPPSAPSKSPAAPSFVDRLRKTAMYNATPPVAGAQHLADAPRKRPRKLVGAEREAAAKEYDGLVDKIFALDWDHPYLGDMAEVEYEDASGAKHTSPHKRPTTLTYRERLALLLDNPTGINQWGGPEDWGKRDPKGKGPRIHKERGEGRARRARESGVLMGTGDALHSVLNGEPANIAKEDVRSLLEKAADMDEDPDLTDIQVDGMLIFGGNGLGVDREDMPQIPSAHRDALLKRLKDNGVKVERETVSPLELAPTQKNISARKVGAMLRRHDNDKHRVITPPLVSKDGHLLDGHHQWGVMAATSVDHPSATMPIYRIDMDTQDALDALEDYAQEHHFQHKGHGLFGDPVEVLPYRERLAALALGGPGSGNFGHAGRPGEVGGSASEDLPSKDDISNAIARHQWSESDNADRAETLHVRDPHAEVKQKPDGGKVYVSLAHVPDRLRRLIFKDRDPADIAHQIVSHIPGDLDVTWETEAHGAGRQTLTMVMKRADGLELTRTFQREGNGTLTVHHDEFHIPEHLQDHDLAKDVLHDSYELYRKMGVDRIDTFADRNVGGYAWAKFGFKADNPAKLADKLADTLHSRRSLHDLTSEQYDAVKGILKEYRNDPRLPWHVAGMVTKEGRQVGKELLLNQGWHASLDMDDAEATERLEHYVAQKKPSKLSPVRPQPAEEPFRGFSAGA